MCVVYLYLATFVAKISVISKGLEVMGNHTLEILLYHGSVATVLFSLIATLNHDS